MAALKRINEWTVEIIKQSDTAKDFESIPRTLGWLGGCRRLAKNFVATIASAVSWAFFAQIRVLTRRIARA
jgi:putative transposase